MSGGEGPGGSLHGVCVFSYGQASSQMAHLMHHRLPTRAWVKTDDVGLQGWTSTKTGQTSAFLRL